MVVVGLAAMALASCGRNPAEEGTSPDNKLVVESYTNVDRTDDAPSMGGYLRYGLPAETNSWNPGLAQWGAHSMQVARAIFDPLFEYDETGEVRPFLLERAEHNADYTEWKLIVRDGVRFHNGRKMTATDLSRVAQQLMASKVVGTAWAINDLSGAEIRDERTLVIRSTKPWVTLPHQSASQLGFVPDPDWMESPDWAHPVGSGPFVVDYWRVGERISLRKNPNYWRSDRWGHKLPYLDRIDYEVVPDDARRFEMLRRRDIDVLMQTAPGAQAGQLIRSARSGGIQLITDNRAETPEDFVLLNTARPQLGDVDTRRALASAVNRDEASQLLTAGVNPPADGIFEPNSPWWTPTNYPSYDPARAREMLAERGGEPLSFTLKGPDTPEGLRSLQFVQAQWAKVGVEVQIEAVKLSRMLIIMLMGDFEALLLQHFDYPNPAPEMVFVNPAQVKPIGEFTLSLPRIRDDGILRAIDGTLHSLDPAARRDAVALLQQRLADLVPYVWLTHARRHIAARRGVMNLVHHSLPDGTTGIDFLLGSHRMDQVWLRPD